MPADGRVLERPRAMQLELTSTCNLRCVMCPLTTGASSTSDRPGPITEDTWDKILPLARRCQQVFIAGYGEPFTNHRCVDLLRDLDAHGVQVSIATNGLVMSSAIARALGELHHLVEVNVSIDSPDPEVYRSLRGASLDRALRALPLLLDVLEPSQVSVSSVLMSANARSLPGFPALLADLGVSHYCLGGVMDYNEFAAASSMLGQRDLRQVVGDIVAECDRHGIYLVIGSEERLWLELDAPEVARERYHARPDPASSDSRQCMVPWEVPFVDKEGTVFACCYAGAGNERPLGTVHGESLEDIWRGAEFQRFRADLVAGGSRVPDPCARCTLVPIGEHPLRQWRAEMESVDVDRGRAVVRLRNTGSRTWRRDDLVRLGSRSGAARVAEPSWLFPERPAGTAEDEVPPGDVATFRFDVRELDEPLVEMFHVVVEGRLWLPEPQIELSVPRRRRWKGLRRRPPGRGDPPVAGFAAELVSVEVEERRVVVRARNTGTRGWAPGDRIRIGTSRPRDGASPYADDAWLQANRAASFAESNVPIGAIATFEFDVAGGSSGVHHFQLVADGACWLAGTEFSVYA